MPEIRRSAYNQAVTDVVSHLRNAATYEPVVRSNGYQRSRLAKVVTNESLDRYIKANKITRDEKRAIQQAFTTLAGRQSRGQSVTAIDVSRLRSLTRTLKGFAASHNLRPTTVLDMSEQKKMGKTAQAIIKAADELDLRNFKKVSTEQQFAKQIDKVLEHLLVKANTGSPYMHWYELVNYSKTLPKTKNGRALKDALWKSFRYLSRTMTRGRRSSTEICMDQRREATRILLKLFAGNSATKKAIAKV